MKIKKILAIALCMSLALTACGGKTDSGKSIASSKENTSAGSSTEKDNSTGDKTISSDNKFGSSVTTLAAIKDKYGVSSADLGVAPLYNIDPNAKFTLHFNSKVDPFSAVTVHTDSKCETDSMLYTINSAYFTREGGIDVIVTSNSSVLECADRFDAYQSADDSWGHANYYYLAIRYDMDATTPTKLDKPIIIPFTLKNEVESPMVGYSITSDGEFKLTWNDTGADEYRIYEVYRPDGHVEDYKDREHGYIGMHLTLTDTVPGGQTSWTIPDLSQPISGQYGESQAYQNSRVPMDYFVSAVKNGKESNFSGELNGAKYRNQLPKEVNMGATFGSDLGDVYYLPETALITMADGSYVNYPIDYTLVDDQWAALDGGNAYVTYKYAVRGTKLSGFVDLYVTDSNYEKEVRSTASVNATLYEPKVDISMLQSDEYPTIPGVDNRAIDLTTVKEYNPNSRVVFNGDALNKRMDLETARMVTDGVYTSDPFAIQVVDYNDHQNDLEARRQQLGDIYTVSGETQVTPETSSAAPVETTAAPVETTEAPVETEPETTAPVDVSTPPEEVTPDNVIDTVIDTTNDNITDGDEITVTIPEGYMMFATSPEEEYLALNLLSQQEYIRIDVLPNLLYGDNLIDTLYKVMYQNPYFMGFDTLELGTNEDRTQVLLKVDYTFDNETAARMQEEIKNKAAEVLTSTINDSMSPEEKINAIWKYLEENTQYDQAILEQYLAARESGNEDTFSTGDSTSFCTYGILCKGLGVCQSYAYTMSLLGNMAGVDTIMVTGDMEGVGHAWNAINIDGWHWFDSTNNYNSTFIPYFVYNTSSDFAQTNGYNADDGFALDTEVYNYMSYDQSHDYYNSNGLVAHNIDEAADIFVKLWQSSEYDPFAIRLDPSANIVVDQQFASTVAQKAAAVGITQDELMNCATFELMGHIIVAKNIDEFKAKVASMQ